MKIGRLYLYWHWEKRDKRRETYIRLMEMLKPHASLQERGDDDFDEKKNQEARAFLYTFYEELKKVKPDTHYNCELEHLSYFFYFFHIRKAFEDRNYRRVCDEIQVLLHDEPFRQPRIYYNLLRLLERYLEIGDVA